MKDGKTDKDERKKHRLLKLLKAWQIMELGLLFISLPISFAYAIMLSGDGNHFLKFYTRYILPVIGVLLTLKIVVTVMFYKHKRWSYYYNYIESILLTLSAVTALAFSIIAVIGAKGSLIYLLLIIPSISGITIFLFITKSYKFLWRNPE